MKLVLQGGRCFVSDIRRPSLWSLPEFELAGKSIISNIVPESTTGRSHS